VLKTIRDLNQREREQTLERVLNAFIIFCRQNFQFDLYDYQIRIARACLSSLLVEPKDVFIKLARQSGKTETITLLLRFLIIFYRLLTGDPLMAGIASPKGEQAKTDLDRLKKSINELRNSWQVEDREYNAHTVRAYRFNKLFAEIFKFSLGNTTNESKTLNVLVVEEAHKIDDKKRSDQLDPMLSSTGGVTWHIGVGCPKYGDFKKGCDGEMPDSVVVKVDVEEVIHDRRKKYEETGDPKHLEYEKAFQRELRKKGKDNPEIRMNYYLEDIVEISSFISRERLLSCARGKDAEINTDKLGLGLDWARESDETIATLSNPLNDVAVWFAYPHVRYEDQIQMLLKDLEPFREKIAGVRSDATGQGDGPSELLENTWLPCGPDTKFKFTTQSKNDLYVNFEQSLFADEGDKTRFSYPADHPLAEKFEGQMLSLVREYIGDGEYLSVHHPKNDPNGRDDLPDSTALSTFAAKNAGIGDIIVF